MFHLLQWSFGGNVRIISLRNGSASVGQIEKIFIFSETDSSTDDRATGIVVLEQGRQNAVTCSKPQGIKNQFAANADIGYRTELILDFAIYFVLCILVFVIAKFVATVAYMLYFCTDEATFTNDQTSSRHDAPRGSLGVFKSALPNGFFAQKSTLLPAVFVIIVGQTVVVIIVQGIDRGRMDGCGQA